LLGWAALRLVADFFCLDAPRILELDGRQHGEECEK
jgi:very-short-patch-repair endonuclease